MFSPSSFWTMAPLRYTAKFDPFLSLDCARVEGVGAQSKSHSPEARGAKHIRCKNLAMTIWQPYEIILSSKAATKIRLDTAAAKCAKFGPISFFLPSPLQSDVPLRVIRTKLLQNNARNTETTRGFQFCLYLCYLGEDRCIRDTCNMYRDNRTL